ncbi:MAG: nitrate/nitrite transporter NrtS [Thiohalomonadales bacterium]
MKIWLRCACEPKVVWRATKYAFFVGIILILINHGDDILRGEVTGVGLIKMGFTILVPYLVSTSSSVGAILDRAVDN